MPTTSPYMLNSAPPELPELMAVSVWMRPIIAPEENVTWRLSALTTPSVRLKVSSPSGLPMAATLSPTRRASESPRVTGRRSFASTFKTATSLLSSKPMISAL